MNYRSLTPQEGFEPSLPLRSFSRAPLARASDNFAILQVGCHNGTLPHLSAIAVSLLDDMAFALCTSQLVAQARFSLAFPGVTASPVLVSAPSVLGLDDWAVQGAFALHNQWPPELNASPSFSSGRSNDLSPLPLRYRPIRGVRGVEPLVFFRSFELSGECEANRLGGERSRI